MLETDDRTCGQDTDEEVSEEEFSGEEHVGGRTTRVRGEEDHGGRPESPIVISDDDDDLDDDDNLDDDNDESTAPVRPLRNLRQTSLDHWRRR